MAKAKVISQMYVWEGKDSAGKRVKGEISGQSEALVRAILRRQKINPTKVKKKPKPLFGSGKSKIDTKDICVWSRQLATMMSLGFQFEISGGISRRCHEKTGMD